MKNEIGIAKMDDFKQVQLCKAQKEKNYFIESRLIPEILKSSGKSFRSNQNCKKTIYDRFLEKLSFGSSDCWYFSGYIDQLGYGRLTVLSENKAHRVSWKLFYGDIPKGKKVLHKCDIRNCVNPEHLFLGTQSDNVNDMVSKKRNKSPGLSKEKNRMSKLTMEKVLEMRSLYEKGNLSYSKIGKLFSISQMTAYRAINLQSWK